MVGIFFFKMHMLGPPERAEELHKREEALRHCILGYTGPGRSIILVESRSNSQYGVL
jgi:hypothetical protein